MKKNNLFPLIYGKPEDKAIINPTDVVNFLKGLKDSSRVRYPPYGILSFMGSATKVLKSDYETRMSKWGQKEVYLFQHNHTEIGYVLGRFGAPMAGADLELMIALGFKYFIFMGAVGVLQEDIQRGEILVPIKAIRDEGTSYHYARPSKYSYPSKTLVKSLQEVLKKRAINYRRGISWTTDAFYRETMRKMRKYRDEGALSVEMEASALFSIAKFRKKDIAGLFIAGDSIAGSRWNPRKDSSNMEKIESEKSILLRYAIETFDYINTKNLVSIDLTKLSD